MNLPNKLTLTRIILSPVFMIFLFIDSGLSRLLALFIFVVASLTDLYDGYLARKTGVITSFGKFMDPLADKLLTSTAFISFVALGYVKAWMVVAIVVRELFITGLRSLAAYRGVVIPSSILARWKTVSQMVVIFLILLFVNLRSSLFTTGHQWTGVEVQSLLRIFNTMVFLVMVITVGTGIQYLVRYAALLRGLMK